MDIEGKANRVHYNADSAKKGRSAGARRTRRCAKRRARRDVTAILTGGRARGTGGH